MGEDHGIVKHFVLMIFLAIMKIIREQLKLIGMWLNGRIESILNGNVMKRV